MLHGSSKEQDTSRCNGSAPGCAAAEAARTPVPTLAATEAAGTPVPASGAAAAPLLPFGSADRALLPTCLELLQQERCSSKVPFLLPSLDSALCGGLLGGRALAEISGPSGAGKSCLLLQLCATYLTGTCVVFSHSDAAPPSGSSPFLSHSSPAACAYRSAGASPGCAIYVDCDGGFRAERFVEIAQGAFAACTSTGGKEAAEALLRRLVVLRVFSLAELLQLLEAFLPNRKRGRPHPLDAFPLLAHERQPASSREANPHRPPAE
ncbi:hypothetical protein cyc_08895, partial [Cyclospora cayetanensis]